jgi:hypothetical protein
MAEKKTVKTYITSTGARQSGSSKDARKHEQIAFKNFLKNPTPKTLEILERIRAAASGAKAKEIRDESGKDSKFAELYDDMEKISKSAADSDELKRLKKKAKSLLRR